MKRLKRFSEADNRHIRGCAYCQSKLLKNAVRTFNESEKKVGGKMRADEDAVFAAPLPEKSRFSASEGGRMCSACETRTDDAEARYCSTCGGKLVDVEDDSEAERDVRRGERQGESQKLLASALKKFRETSRRTAPRKA